MKLFVFTAVFIATWASSSFGWLTSIQIQPSQPTVGEPVTIIVTGEMPDTCWSVLGHNCLGPVEGEINLEIFTYDCAGRECQICLAVVIPFEVVCTYEFTEPGIYDVLAVEHWDSLIPRFYPDLTTSFEVSDSVATVSSTWSALKCLYR